MPQLTEVAIKAAKPKEKMYRLYDGKGLYLEIIPKGGKYWRGKYRYEGKEKRMAYGVYPETSLKEARERHLQARKFLQQGIDPSTHKKMLKLGERGDAFEAVAREWFLKHEPRWAKSHSSKIIGRFEADVFPHIGNRRISDIEAPELLATIRRIEERGAVDTAHRALTTCGQVFRYAIATGRAKRDLSQDLRGAIPPAKKGHLAAITDPKEFGVLLRDIDGYKGQAVVRAALKLAPLVFVRPKELRSAEWVEIDLEKAEWVIPAGKMKMKNSHLVPLSNQAVGILRDLKPVTGNGKYVFPSARSVHRPMSDNAILAALRTLGYTTDRVTGHGFRATARTLLDEVLGFRPDYIEHQLAHSVRDPLGRAYNRTTHLPERRRMMQVWADYLDGLKII